MQLDNRTLMFSSLLVTMVLSLLDILIWRLRTTVPGFGRWAIAHALFAPTLLLFSLRMVLPDWVTIGAANIIATALTVIVVEAAREFRGLPPRAWQAYAAGALNLSLIFFFRYAVNNLNVRILVAGTFLGGSVLYAAKVLLSDIPKDREIGMKYTGWLLVVCGLLQLWRGIYYFMQPPIADLFAPTKVNAISFIGVAVALTGISFGVIVMSGERLMSDLRNSERQTANANFELNRLRRDLETAVIERTAELRETQQALGNSQKLESLGRLAGGVAHDFNNFLTVIRGYSRLLAQNLDPASPLRDDVTEMNAACEQAMLLTQQLLAFSRRQFLEPKVLDLNQAILSMAKLLAQLLGDDIEVVIVTGAADARVKADLGQMHQVILNLFLNARDAMPQGGRLTIETSGRVDRRRSAALPRCPGRPLCASLYPRRRHRHERGDEKPRLRALLHHQADGARHGAGPGDGVRNREAERRAHPGGDRTGRRHHLPDSISTQPRGTCAGARGECFRRSFFFGQIRARFDRRRCRAHPDGAAARARKRRIRSDGHGRRRQRARSSAAEPVDVVLTDVQMPGRSGVELARLVVREFPGIKVIAMSGFEDSHLSRLPAELGIDAALPKPMHPDALIGAVREAMARA